MPWILLPLLPLFTCYLAIADQLRAWPAYLLIPVAAWLGRRHGARGAITVAVGAGVALLPTFLLGPFEFGGTPDLYVMALWVSIACAAVDPLRTLIGDGRLYRSTGLFIAALVLLPMSLKLGTHAFEDGTALNLWIGPRPLFLFFLFLCGLAGFPPRHAVAALTIAALTGMAIRSFGVENSVTAAIAAGIDPEAPWINDFRVRYEWNDLANLATGLAFFFTGRLIERRRAGRQEQSATWRHAYFAVASLTALAALGTVSGQLLPRLPDAASLAGIDGDYFALPVAGFLAGLLLRHLGVAFCLGLFVALIAGSNLVAASLGYGGLSIALEQPVICLSYGMLGVSVRTLLDGAAIPFAGKRWVQYALLVFGIIAIVTSPSELADLAKALAIAVGGALVAAVAQWVRRKLGQGGIQISGEGWLMLAAIVAVTAWAALNGRAIASVLLAAAEELDVPEGMAVVILVVLLHVPVALLVAGMSACLPKVWSDLRMLAGRRRPDVMMASGSTPHKQP
jgi:hypothetical protein